MYIILFFFSISNYTIRKTKPLTFSMSFFGDFTLVFKYCPCNCVKKQDFAYHTHFFIILKHIFDLSFEVVHNRNKDMKMLKYKHLMVTSQFGHKVQKLLKMFISYDLGDHAHLRSNYFWAKPNYHYLLQHMVIILNC